MNYIYIGQIVNTHGIKGEVRIKSDFKYKKDIFKKDFNIYIGNDKIKQTINTYRIHKDYDMITFNNITDINDVLDYKGLNVYVVREELNIDGILDEDIIGMNVYSDTKEIGLVTDILKSKAHDILVIEKDKKRYLVPYIDEFVNIDINNKKIMINEIEGLLDEN